MIKYFLILSAFLFAFQSYSTAQVSKKAPNTQPAPKAALQVEEVVIDTASPGTYRWPGKERDAFIKGCQSRLTWGKDSSQKYCECMLSKAEALFPSASEMGKMDKETLIRMGKECLWKIR